MAGLGLAVRAVVPGDREARGQLTERVPVDHPVEVSIAEAPHRILAQLTP